jgi:hypothetical protein
MTELIELFNHEKHINGIDKPDTLESEILEFINEKIQMKISEITIFGNPLKYRILKLRNPNSLIGYDYTGQSHSKKEAERIVNEEKLTSPNSIFRIELL